jgi:hypothetical protein
MHGMNIKFTDKFKKCEIEAATALLVRNLLRRLHPAGKGTCHPATYHERHSLGADV